jgi:D-lactate dehydrogenase (cytochrome)
MDFETAFLEDILGREQVTTAADALESHATDWGSETGTEPEVVVYPTGTREVADVLAAAHERGVPVTPYAAGTSLEGNPIPVEGGISMNLTRMDEIVEVRPEDRQMDVQPGVMGSDLDPAAGKHGLFFPPLPSSGDISTIGGMIANAASGMQTVRYGEIADWVLELEVALADGSVVTAGSKAVKTSSGYNLRDLFVGSEGTLGVVTQATLGLEGRPQERRGGRALFGSLSDATAAVTDVVQSGVDVAKIELIDTESARMANEYSSTDLPDLPMVFLEFHADHGIEAEIDFCRTVMAAHDPERFELAGEAEMERLWQLRRDLAFAVRAYDPDLQPLTPGDVTVPISEYGPIIEYAKQLESEHGLLIPCFGHAGDGNVHYTVMVDPTDPDEVERGQEIYADIVGRAIDVGGTATGEHGIGLGKREFLLAEHGGPTVEAMQAVKDALDPAGILNPGKIFPAEGDDTWQRADVEEYE